MRTTLPGKELLLLLFRRPQIQGCLHLFIHILKIHRLMLGAILITHLYQGILLAATMARGRLHHTQIKDNLYLCILIHLCQGILLAAIMGHGQVVLREILEMPENNTHAREGFSRHV
jgi:hypothetical protein